MRGNDEGEGLNKFEDKNKGKVVGYVIFPFIIPPQKESNCLIDMGKKTKNVNHLI